MRTRKRKPSQLEEDDKPLEILLDRLVSKGAAHRNARIIMDPEGRVGLLLSLKPQRRELRDDGRLVLVSHEEEMPVTMHVAPGIKPRPVLKVELAVHLLPSQMAAYRDWVASTTLPTQVLPSCT